MKKKLSAENKLNVNVGFYGGLVPGNTAQLEEMIGAGVLGIKCFLTHSGIDEFPNVTEKDLDEAMPILARHQIPLLVHCELSDNELNSGLEENPRSYKHYLASRPKQWENDAIALMIKLCRKHQCAVHIVHVSSAEALPLIEEAKAAGLPITAETCAQYIYFNAEAIPDGNCLYKCAPPIREKENNEQLKKALASGVLDFISTDHSPAPPSIKEIATGNLKNAWGGIAGLQFLLSASWTALKELLPLEKFIPLLTERPAHFLQVDHKKGFLKVGYDADFTVWDPAEKHVIDTEEILFRHKISPYIGESMFAGIEQTIVNGITVYENKKKIIAQYAGKIVLAK